MELQDTLYGRIEISEPLLVDLLAAPEIQRLKGLRQSGIPKRYSGVDMSGMTRYDHSVGTMILLGEHEASPLQQARGLLHDVSHAAFSHVYDWLRGDPVQQTYHHENYARFLESSSIPVVLKKHDLSIVDLNELLADPLVQMPLPHIAADRIDYALREFVLWANPSAVQPSLDDIVIVNGRFAFESKEVARTFGETFLRCQLEHWGSTDNMIRYALLSQVLCLAMKKEIVALSDFSATDEYIMKKVESSDDIQIQQMLGLLRRRDIPYEHTEKDPDIKAFQKFRFVDPGIIVRGAITPLSDVDAEYKMLVGNARKKTEEGISVRLLA